MTRGTSPVAEPRPKKARFARRLLRLTVAWLLLTTLTAWIHVALWSPTSAPLIPTESALVKPVANAVHMVALPGWLATMSAIGRDNIHTFPGALLAHGLTFAALIIAWLCLDAFRRTSIAFATVPLPHRTNVNEGRRRFVINAATAAAVVGPGATIVHAAAIAPEQLLVRRYRIPIRDLPAPLHGLRLVQLSDTHLGPRVSAAYLRRVIRQAVDLQPDLFLLTGDYVHDGVQHIDLAVELFQPLIDAPSIGVVGTLGNHDWWADGPRISRQLTDRGVHMIDNDRIFLDADSRTLVTTPVTSALCIAGVGDLNTDVVDFTRALRDVDPDTPRLLLSHNPDCAELPELRGSSGRLKPDAPGRDFEAPARPLRVDLMLSGHTHGGQVSIPFLGPLMVPSAYGARYAGGLNQGPVCPVLTSRGVGTSLLPVRFRVPPELVEIELIEA